MTQPYEPLGLYVHWPFCKAKCPYCDFNSHVSAEVDFNGFKAGLLREMAYLAKRLPSKPPLNSIFFGGGTPSLMPPTIVAAVIEQAEAIFGFADNIEITAEANPTSVEAANLAAFHSAGVNRVSLGVQALRAEQLAFLGREHSVSEALSALEVVRRLFERVSIDLIYGLPGQTDVEWETTLKQLLSIGLDHLSLYQLTIEPGTAFYSQSQRGAVMTGSDDLVATLFEQTNSMTAAAGLAAYEVSNYARQGHECRHNLIYWRAHNWLGIGPGAHSRFDHCQTRVGLANRRSPKAWLERALTAGHGIETESGETGSERAAEMLMMGLRLSEGVSLNRIENKCGSHTHWLDLPMLRRHVKNGFLELSENRDRLKTTAKGRLFLNMLLSDLLQ